MELIFFVVNRSWWEGDNVCVDKKVLNKPKRHNYGPYKCDVRTDRRKKRGKRSAIEMLCVLNPLLIYAPGEFLIKIIDGDGIDGINIRASPAVLSTTKVGNNWTIGHFHLISTEASKTSSLL